MKNFKVNGINVIDYEGTGEVLIFVHAFPLCNRMWDAQVEYFRNKYRIITYDIRGLGYSNELRDYQFTMEELVNDFINLLDHLNLEKVNACGLSMGGYILLRAVIRNQNRFSSVILADTKSMGEDNLSLITRSESIIKLKSGKKDEFLSEFIKDLLSQEGYDNEKIKSFVNMMMQWMDVKGLCANLIAIATRTSTFFQLKDIIIPTLIIVGRNDKITPVIYSYYLKENISNSKFKVIEGAGHLSNIEQPKEFNKTIEDFFSKLHLLNHP